MAGALRRYARGGSVTEGDEDQVQVAQVPAPDDDQPDPDLPYMTRGEVRRRMVQERAGDPVPPLPGDAGSGTGADAGATGAAPGRRQGALAQMNPQRPTDDQTTAQDADDLRTVRRAILSSLPTPEARQAARERLVQATDALTRAYNTPRSDTGNVNLPLLAAGAQMLMAGRRPVGESVGAGLAAAGRTLGAEREATRADQIHGLEAERTLAQHQDAQTDQDLNRGVSDLRNLTLANRQLTQGQWQHFQLRNGAILRLNRETGEVSQASPPIPTDFTQDMHAVEEQLREETGRIDWQAAPFSGDANLQREWILQRRSQLVNQRLQLRENVTGVPMGYPQAAPFTPPGGRPVGPPLSSPASRQPPPLAPASPGAPGGPRLPASPGTPPAASPPPVAGPAGPALPAGPAGGVPPPAMGPSGLAPAPGGPAPAGLVAPPAASGQPGVTQTPPPVGAPPGARPPAAGQPPGPQGSPSVPRVPDAELATAGLPPGTPINNPAVVAGREAYARTLNTTMVEQERTRPELETTKHELTTLRDALTAYGRSGVGTPTWVSAARAIEGLTGITVDRRLPAAELFEKIQNYLAPRMRVVGAGASSDRDVDIFFRSIPNFSNSYRGNLAILDHMLDRTDYQLATLNQMAQYAATHGGALDAQYILSRARFAQQWYDQGRDREWRRYFNATSRNPPAQPADRPIVPGGAPAPGANPFRR